MRDDISPEEGAPGNQTYVLISDIHSNLPALQAVLADIAKGQPAAVYHLGDLVGYMSSPNEVVKLLRDSGIAGVAGNYDSTVATDYKHCGCRADTPHDEELAHISFAWTRKAVMPETKVFLGGLPFRIDIRPLGGHMSGAAPVVAFARVGYDIDKAAKGIEDNGLPMEFAEHLRTGGRKH